MFLLVVNLAGIVTQFYNIHNGNSSFIYILLEKHKSYVKDNVFY